MTDPITTPEALRALRRDVLARVDNPYAAAGVRVAFTAVDDALFSPDAPTPVTEARQNLNVLPGVTRGGAGDDQQEALALADRLAATTALSGGDARVIAEAALALAQPTVTTEQVKAAREALYGSDLVLDDTDPWAEVVAAVDAVLAALGIEVTP